MASIDIRHPHGTNRQDASARTKALLDDFAAKRPEIFKEIDWSADGTRANAKGPGFKGEFTVTDSDVVVAIDLGLLARAFKGKIEEGLTRRLQNEFGG